MSTFIEYDLTTTLWKYIFVYLKITFFINANKIQEVFKNGKN